MFVFFNKKYSSSIYRLLVFATTLFIFGCGDGDIRVTTPPETQTPEVKKNVAPVAVAGNDIDTFEGREVIVDASKSTDSDGQITSYSWAQIKASNTEPNLSIKSGQTSPRAFITIPILASDTSFTVRLTVTDNKGATATDDLVIKAQKVPSVITTSPTGNTATFLGQARFNVSLNTMPSANVVIAVTSSDTSEGTPSPNMLTFTSANYNQPQVVTVTGRNQNVQNGSQNYRITLAASSSDSAYDGLQIPSVLMEGLVLRVNELKVIKPFAPEVLGTASPDLTYTGTQALTYSLVQSPTGMTIDSSTGLISWTPANDDAGETVAIEVRVTDGALTSNKTFSITVIKPQAVTVNVSGGTLTIRDTNTNLNGLTIGAVDSSSTLSLREQTSRSLDDAKLEVISRSAAPRVPDGIGVLSDIFRVIADTDATQTVAIPVPDLPDGVTDSDVNIYVYSQPMGESDGYWTPIAVNTRVETVNNKKLFKADLKGFEGLLFIGHHSTLPALAASSSSRSQGGVSYVSRMSDVISTTELPDQAIASCEKITSREGSFLCDSILFQGVKVLISHFGNGQRWGSVTVEQLATWVLLLQKAADEYITLPPELILQVNIEPTPEGILVFVTTDDAEKFSVLHMTDDNSVKKEDIQLALVHQFAYQLAYRITVAVAKELDFDLTNINWNDPQYLWIIEALAVALEDEVFDDRNSYRKRFTPIDRILEKGINQQATEPGQGFAVIKMILTKCKLNDSLKDSLEKIVEGVRAGASKTKILELVEASLVVAKCDFGPQLGVKAKSSVISASLLYQYASLFKGDISLLDDNETKDGSDFVPTTYVFAQGGKEWLNTVQEWIDREDKSDYQLVGVTSIPPLGVYSFFIEPIEGTFPQNLIPYIMIDATNDDGKLLASFASDDDAFVGTSTLGSSKHIILGVTAAQNTLPYNFGGKAPKIFVTLINSDPDKTVQIKGIKFNIKDLTK